MKVRVGAIANISNITDLSQDKLAEKFPIVRCNRQNTKRSKLLIRIGMNNSN